MTAVACPRSVRTSLTLAPGPIAGDAAVRVSPCSASPFVGSVPDYCRQKPVETTHSEPTRDDAHVTAAEAGRWDLRTGAVPSQAEGDRSTPGPDAAAYSDSSREAETDGPADA